MSHRNVMSNHNIVHLGVGIDTARYAHHVSFLDEQKRTATKAFHFKENAQGYQKLRDAIDRLAGKHGPVHFHFHIDVAGQYAENLLQWLHGLPADKTISVGQPARNKAYRTVHFDKRKADPAESLSCARLAIVERPEATPHNPPEFRQLRDIVALREAAATQETRLVNQLHGLLARVFPELALHAGDLSAGWVLTLLDRYPTPAKIARARLETLARIPHLGRETARDIQDAAAASLGSNRGEIAEHLVRQKVGELRRQQTESAKIDKLLRQIFALWKKDEDFDPEFESRTAAGDSEGETETGHAGQGASQPESEAAQEAAGEAASRPESDAVRESAGEAAIHPESDAVREAESEGVASHPATEKQTAASPRKAVKPPEKGVITASSRVSTECAEDKLRPLDFRRLRDQLSIATVLEHWNWEPRQRSGKEWRGRCPLHESEDSRSVCFAVEPEKSLYCCHRCGSQGNVLDLWVSLSGLPILSASWDLVERFGLTPPLLRK